MRPTRLAVWSLAAFMAMSPALAQDAGKPAAKPQTTEAGQSRDLPADVTTEHALGIGDRAIRYTATAGTLPMTNDKGETIAKIFYVAYTVAGPDRPVSFVFNGGPGAASAFLHLGAIGPRVLNFSENGAIPESPVALSDNPDSWLPFTDLVFVDPVGTGFSRGSGSGEEAEKAFYGVEKDADAMTDFARLYLTRNGRNLSNVYVVGESYGGFRAALLSNRLLKEGVQVKGTILISPALEFSMIRGDEFALVPLALKLPSIAASYIEKSQGYNASLEPVAEVESFARSDYLVQLVGGLKVDGTTLDKLTRMTGLDREVIARNHGRVTADLFRREYLQKEDRTISLYDGSVSLPMPRPAYRSRLDPILDAAVNVLTPLMVDYARDDLGYRTDLPYNLLNRELSQRWDFGTTPSRQGYAGSLDELQNARTLNRNLKVFVAHGYTDLVTPYGVSQFLVDQLEPIDGARPIDVRVYRGGHMMYMRPASRALLSKDVRALYEDWRKT
jgi:carboxypeptidase C (cathepsin A)